MDSSTLLSPPPQLDAGACLNEAYAGNGQNGSPNEARDGALCTRCADRCPANAIALREGRPELDTAACTGCTGCVDVCPVSAITHEDVRPMRWIAEARQRQTAGAGRI
ncbi:MAG: 4Fe-4S dicluster domain-containing protein, partial [Calditrichaeota bacterium]